MDLPLVSTMETKSVLSLHVTSAQMNNLRFFQLIFSDALTLHHARQTPWYLGDQNVSDKCWKVPLICIVGIGVIR